MKTVSLDALRDREHQLLDHEYDDSIGLGAGTTTDRYMELNDGRMGEDCEEVASRQEHTRKVLSNRPLPSYNPFG